MTTPQSCLLPPTVRYGERYPVVVFAGLPDAQRWSDARSDVAADTDAGIVITGAGINSLSSSFWSSVTALPWADPSQLFVITPDLPGPSDHLPRGSTLLLPKALAKNFSAPAAVRVRAIDGDGPDGFEMKSAAFIIESLGKGSH